MNCCVALASTAVGDDEPDTGDVVSDVLTGTTDTADTQNAFVNVMVLNFKEKDFRVSSWYAPQVLTMRINNCDLGPVQLICFSFLTCGKSHIENIGYGYIIIYSGDLISG
jgi:hypothetical protein